MGTGRLWERGTDSFGGRALLRDSGTTRIQVAGFVTGAWVQGKSAHARFRD